MTSDHRRLPVGDAPAPAAVVEAAREVLARGGLAALPTETGYGLSTRADAPDALARLRRAAGSSAAVWLVGGPAALERLPGPLGMPLRLAARYWPGPLTLVLPGIPGGLEALAVEGWTAVRCPAQRATTSIAEALDLPLALIETGARSAEELARVHPGIELVLDAGPARLREPASILRLGRGRFELEREGLVSLERLREAAGLRIGFVCTGNTCRSPLAEALARRLVAERLGVLPARLHEHGFRFRSMGTHAGHGLAASRLALRLGEKEGLDLSPHRSRAAAAEDLRGYDRLYGLTRGHVEELSLLLPPGRDGHVHLLDPDGRDVPDPMGGTEADYAEAFARIRAALERRVAEWI